MMHVALGEAYNVGRVIDPPNARLQCIGGMGTCTGMAVSEQVDWAPRFGRMMNADLAEHLAPVNADVGDFDVPAVPAAAVITNPLGSERLSKIVLCDMAPATAACQATAEHVRHLPIIPRKLLCD